MQVPRVARVVAQTAPRVFRAQKKNVPVVGGISNRRSAAMPPSRRASPARYAQVSGEANTREWRVALCGEDTEQVAEGVVAEAAKWLRRCGQCKQQVPARA